MRILSVSAGSFIDVDTERFVDAVENLNDVKQYEYLLDLFWEQKWKKPKPKSKTDAVVPVLKGVTNLTVGDDDDEDDEEEAEAEALLSTMNGCSAAP